MEKYQTIEHSIITKFRPTIYRLFVRAIDEYKLIKDGMTVNYVIPFLYEHLLVNIYSLEI